MERPEFTDEQRAYFRAANARRARVVKPCASCGMEMPPSYPSRRFCSPRCQKRARRAELRKGQPNA
jgi:hypothetical protein